MSNNIKIQSWNVKLFCDTKFPVIDIKNSDFLKEHIKYNKIVKLKILNSNYPTEVLDGEIIDEKFRSQYQIDNDLVPIMIHANWLGYPIGYKSIYITLVNELNYNEQYFAMNQNSDSDDEEVDMLENYEKDEHDTDKNMLYITSSVLLIILLSIILYLVNR